MRSTNVKTEICQKILCFVSLLIFSICSAVIGASIFYATLSNKQEELKTLHVWIFSASVFLLFVSVAGCGGSLRKNKALIKFNIFCSILCSLIIVAISVTIFVCQRQIKETTIKILQESIYEMRGTWEVLQSEFKCCGVVDARDWGAVIPESCEVIQNGVATGCYGEWAKQNIVILVVFSAIILFLLFVDLIASLSLLFQIKEDEGQRKAIAA